MRRIIQIILAVGVLLSLVSVVSAQTSPIQIIGGNEASLRLLVSHIIGNPVADVVGGDEASLHALTLALAGGGPVAANQKITVYVAALPDNLPFELPLPENANIIGSIDRGQAGGVDIMLDIPSQPDKVIAFFDQSLNTSDWTALEGSPGAVGFVDQTSDSKRFCSSNNAVLLTINAQTTDNGNSATDLYVVNQPDTSTCASVGEGSYAPGDNPYAVLPQLKTPEGVELLPQYGGGGGSGGSPGFQMASISVVLKSTISIGDLADAYKAELEAAGWTYNLTESGEHLSYSMWNIAGTNGHDWVGVFTLTESPLGPHQYTAELTVQEVVAP